LTPINTKLFFVFQGVKSENLSIVIAVKDLCGDAKYTCITVAIYKMAELDYIIKPVYSLILEVEVRYNYLTYTIKVINIYIF
jgi:hypothetical protein